MAKYFSWANFAEAMAVLRDCAACAALIYTVKKVTGNQAWLYDLDTEQEELTRINYMNAMNIVQLFGDMDSRLQRRHLGDLETSLETLLRAIRRLERRVEELEKLPDTQELLVEKLERALQRLVEMKEQLRQHERAIERLVKGVSDTGSLAAAERG